MAADIAALAPVALKRGIERIVDDLYSSAKEGVSSALKKWTATRNIDGLYKKLKAVRYVKTIWQVEKEVDLAAFYYPSRIMATREDRATINDVADFPYSGNIVVQGTVGQGKSIFFRYLTCREMVKGVSLPLFVELRRVPLGTSIIDHVLAELRALGLEMDQKTFEFLAAHGKVMLFLDAFDELKDEQVTDFVTELERLSVQFEHLRVYVSTRRDTAITKSPRFRVYDLAPLIGNEHEKVIHRMCDDGATAERIIKGVRAAGQHVSSLLSTPLMVALLVVRYRVDQSVPQNAISFFDQLFLLLLQRHDKSKAGYVRARKSGLGDLALQDSFEALCFLTRRDGQGAFSLQSLRKSMAEALRITQHTADPEVALGDIIKITCLVLEEGGECKFIHKSMQEYYAACFIRGQPDEAARRFYAAMLEGRWGRWRMELGFLQSMDPYRFRKYFLIPNLQSFIGFTAESVPAKMPNAVKLRCFGDVTLFVNEEDHEGSLGMHFGTTSECWLLENDSHSIHTAAGGFQWGFFDLGVDDVWDAATEVMVDLEPGQAELQVKDIPPNHALANKVQHLLDNAYSYLTRELKAAAASVSQVEADRQIFELLP